MLNKRLCFGAYRNIFGKKLFNGIYSDFCLLVKLFNLSAVYLEKIVNLENFIVNGKLSLCAGFADFFDNISRHLQKECKRLCNNLIERKENGELDEHRETSARRIEVLSLIELHNLLIHFLLRSFVISSRILLSDDGFIGSETCLLNGVLLLLYSEGEQNDLHEDGKENECYNVVRADGINPSERIRYNTAEEIPHDFYLPFLKLFIHPGNIPGDLRN